MLAGAAAALLVAAGAAAEPAKKVRFCDELLITISAGSVVQHETTVAPDGLIEIPGIGAQPAAGFAPGALASAIANRLREPGREASVSVAIVRRDAPDCSVIELPPTPRPEPEPILDVLVFDDEEGLTLPEIEFDLPDRVDTEP